jgi:hypothetical protein
MNNGIKTRETGEKSFKELSKLTGCIEPEHYIADIKFKYRPQGVAEDIVQDVTVLKKGEKLPSLSEETLKIENLEISTSTVQ